jgi:peptidoglycan/LPS O-acetylase OafA/YrhL
VAVTAAVAVSLLMGKFSPSELTAYSLLHAAGPVIWSLSCEAFFYIMFPLSAGRMPEATSWVLWGIVGAAIVAVLVIGAISSLIWDQDVVRWLTCIFPPTRFIEFVLGIALGFFLRRGFRSPFPIWVAVVMTLGALFLASIAPGGLKVAAITLIPFVILVLSLANRDVTERRSIFSSRVIVELGVWSYCFYLIHAIFYGCFVRAGELVGLTPPFALAISSGAPVRGAWLIHVIVDGPAERLLQPPRFPPRFNVELVEDSTT